MTSVTAERPAVQAINHEPLVNPEVFRVPTPLTPLEVMSGVRKPVIPSLSGEELALMTTQIYSSIPDHARNWDTFRHEEYAYGGRFTFTPWFNAHYSGVQERPVVVDDRLRVVFPTHSAPNPIIHYERRIREGFYPSSDDNGQVFKGFEMVLSASAHEASQTALLIGGGRIDETDAMHWPVLSEMTAEAHKLFASTLAES